MTKQQKTDRAIDFWLGARMTIFILYVHTEKVSINIASEASYVYIFSRQKFIQNAKSKK